MSTHNTGIPARSNLLAPCIPAHKGSVANDVQSVSRLLTVRKGDPDERLLRRRLEAGRIKSGTGSLGECTRRLQVGVKIATGVSLPKRGIWSCGSTGRRLDSAPIRERTNGEEDLDYLGVLAIQELRIEMVVTWIGSSRN